MAWRAAELPLFTPSAKLPIKVQSTIAERGPLLVRFGLRAGAVAMSALPPMKGHRQAAPAGPKSASNRLMRATLGLCQGDWCFTPRRQIAASEYLLFLKVRDRLDATGFRSGKGDPIASMQRV